MRKARRQWEMIVRLQAKTGETVRARGMMYKAKGAVGPPLRKLEMIVIEYMLKVLKVFHHGAARWITGMTATCGRGGEW